MSESAPCLPGVTQDLEAQIAEHVLGPGNLTVWGRGEKSWKLHSSLVCLMSTGIFFLMFIIITLTLLSEIITVI